MNFQEWVKLNPNKPLNEYYSEIESEKHKNPKPNNNSIIAGIENFFIDKSEDKFTNVKVVKCKHNFTWDNSMTMHNRFMITENYNSKYNHKLRLEIDYRYVDGQDSVFFVFTYTNIDDGYPGMRNLRLYLILDEEKTIKLDNVSDNNYYSQGKRYVESVQLSISISEFIQVANASKIEYSIRFGSGQLNGKFSDKEMNIIKGFYNATFDRDFEVARLNHFITTQKNIKPKPHPTTKKNGCYIATMAYGDYDHPNVILLRNFRDNYLAKSSLGIKFISIYYRYSPSLVKRFQDNYLINKFVKSLLDLFVKFIK